VHFTPPQLASLFGVNVSTIKRWINKNFLKANVTPGGHRRVSREQLEIFIKKHPQYTRRSYVLNRLNKKGHCPEPDCWKYYYRFLLKSENDKAGQLLEKEYLSGSSILDILHMVITPTMSHIADDWSKKRISVFEEHRMSFYLRSHLLQLDRFISPVASHKPPAAILACAPGEYHELPLQLLALVLKLNGWKSHILGLNISIFELLKAANKIQPKIIIISKTYTQKESIAYFNKLFAYSKKNSICIACGGCTWEKTFKRGIWKNKKCARFFPALSTFNDFLGSYKR